MRTFNEYKFSAGINFLRGILLIVCSIGLCFSVNLLPADRAKFSLAGYSFGLLFFLSGIFFLYRAYKNYSSLSMREKTEIPRRSNKQLISIILLIPVICIFATIVFFTMSGKIKPLFDKKQTPVQETTSATKPEINIEIPQFDRLTIYHFWKTKWGMDKNDIHQLMGGTRLLAEDEINCQLLYRDNNITFNGLKSEDTEFAFGFYTDHAELRYISDPDNPGKTIIDGDNKKRNQKEWLFSIYLNIFLESVKDLPKEDYARLYTQMRQQLIDTYGPPNNFDQIRWGYDGKNYKQYGAFNAGENTQPITYDDLKQNKVSLRVGWVINSRDIMLSLWQRDKTSEVILSFSAMSAPDSPNNKKTKPVKEQK